MDWADRYWMALYDEPYNEERRRMVESGEPDAHLAEVQEYGLQTWTAEQMAEDFEVLLFRIPFVVVRRRSDGQVGSLEFAHNPRVYFDWKGAMHHEAWFPPVIRQDYESWLPSVIP